MSKTADEIDRLRAIIKRLCSDDIRPDILRTPATVRLIDDARSAIGLERLATPAEIDAYLNDVTGVLSQVEVVIDGLRDSQTGKAAPATLAESSRSPT